MDITEVSILHHIGIVLLLLWILSSFGVSYPLVYFISFIYLYQVNECYTLKLRRRLHFEERKQANLKRLLSDSETVRWLNHAVENIWPICMEQIVSQKILLPIIPWFLDKYKPWTATQAVVQYLYLGRNPPMFSEIRVLRQSTDDDHLVLELGMNFLTGDDMSAILAVKLRKSLGFGMWAKMHITGMHIEGKVLVGVKFLHHWPFVGRLRVCFVEPPYFQMTVKPIFSRGLDVSELPGIAGWLDKLLAVAFEQTLVEPNMLVVDVEKFASTPTESSESWFTMDEKCPIAVAKVEVVEAADMKPSDLNGLADPYVKGQLGRYKFQTKTQKKTLTPRWKEEFKIPIHTWESPNMLLLEVRDQDRFVDDTLGDCSININIFRGGQRHDKWLPLQNIKMGRLHVAVTVLEEDGKEGEHLSDKELSNEKESANSRTNEATQQDSTQQAPKMADEFEPINIEGQQQTGIWVHHPGGDVPQTWEPRKREGRCSEIEILREDNDSPNHSGSIAAGSHNSDNSHESENQHGNRFRPLHTIRKSLRMIGSTFQRSPRNESHNDKGEAVPSRINVRAIGEKEIGVRFVLDEENSGAVGDQKPDKESLSPETSDAGSPSISKGEMAKSILKQAGRSAKRALSRKDSHKSKGGLEPSAVAEREVSLGSDSPDKESPPSTKEYSKIIVEGLPIESASGVGSGTESPSAKEENVQLGPSVSARVIGEPVVRKVPFNVADETEGDVAGHGETLVRIVSFRDADRTDDDGSRNVESLDGKVPNQGSGQTDDAIADQTDHGQEVTQPSFLKVSEGTQEEGK